jgi:hypothetical protein
MFGAEKVERLAHSLSGLYENTYCDCTTEEAQEFFFDYVPADHDEEMGGNTELATLSRKLDKIAKGDEKQLLGLVTSISKGTADRLAHSVSDLLDLKEHPCNRGNAILSADLLYPFIEPLLTKSWHELTQDDMFPVLEMLHTGMHAPTCPHFALNTIDNFDCPHLQGGEHGEPAVRI